MSERLHGRMDAKLGDVIANAIKPPACCDRDPQVTFGLMVANLGMRERGKPGLIRWRPHDATPRNRVSATILESFAGDCRIEADRDVDLGLLRP